MFPFSYVFSPTIENNFKIILSKFATKKKKNVISVPKRYTQYTPERYPRHETSLV